MPVAPPHSSTTSGRQVPSGPSNEMVRGAGLTFRDHEETRSEILPGATADGPLRAFLPPSHPGSDKTIDRREKEGRVEIPDVDWPQPGGRQQLDKRPFAKR